MNDGDICQRLVELCKAGGASDVTASMSQGGQGMVRFSNNEVTVVDSLENRSGGLFVNVSGRRGSTTVVEFDRASLERAAKKAISIAKVSPPADLYVPLPQGPFSYDPRLLRSPHVSLEPDDLVGWVHQSIDSGLRAGAERMAGSLIARDGEYTLATSGDVLATTEGGSLELSVRAFGKGQSSGAAVSLATEDKDLDAVRAGAEAGSYAKLAADPVRAEPGEMDAVLGPMVTASLINQVGRMASAFHIDTGMSFLADKLDQELASPLFSLADDATSAGSFGSTPFDAEGLPTRRTMIFENGRFKSYLHNSTTAKKYDAVSTANAGIIAPRPFNLMMVQGEKVMDDLIKEVDRGILVTNNWYLRYQNYSTGDFSTIPRDAMFQIRNGQLGGSVKDLRLSDNLLRLLRNIDGASKERSWVRWWEVNIPTLVPALSVKGVRFTASTQ